MCVCSAKYSAACPRSSTSFAMPAGSSASWVGKKPMPVSMTGRVPERYATSEAGEALVGGLSELARSRSALGLPKGQLAAGGGRHHAAPAGGSLARLERHGGAEVPRAPRGLPDVGHRDVGKPDRTRGFALDDPSAEPAAHRERQVGPVARGDALRPPAAELR